MDGFPFRPDEWEAVEEATLRVVNASLADAPRLHEVYLDRLMDLLGRLRQRYGELPVLLEAEADFTCDPRRRIDLYRRAVGTCEQYGFQTLSIRLSLSRLLIELGADTAARVELSECEPELADADEDDSRTWHELSARLTDGLSRT